MSERVTLAALAAELGLSTNSARKLLKRMWTSGEREIAFTLGPAGEALYPVDAVKAAVRRRSLAELREVEVTDDGAASVAAAAAKSAQFDAYMAQRERRKLEGANAKTNRRTAREARR
jgi:lambda repressor-like predicted transcriptional regulator